MSYSYSVAAIESPHVPVTIWQGASRFRSIVGRPGRVTMSHISPADLGQSTVLPPEEGLFLELC